MLNVLLKQSKLFLQSLDTFCKRIWSSSKMSFLVIFNNCHNFNKIWHTYILSNNEMIYEFPKRLVHILIYLPCKIPPENHINGHKLRNNNTSMVIIFGTYNTYIDMNSFLDFIRYRSKMAYSTHSRPLAKSEFETILMCIN